MLIIKQDGINDYWCDCSIGYYGLNCETMTDNCASSPCHNDANCTVSYNSKY